ncbi:hypothetical protein AD44_5446, partial [Escherichia coli 3-373-03_S4_C3]
MNIKNQPDSGSVFARLLKRILPGNGRHQVHYG